MVTVGKFGGFALRDGKSIVSVVENIILKNPEMRVIAASAPEGVTDELLEIADNRFHGKKVRSELAAINERFAQMAQEVGMEQGYLYLDELVAAIRKKPVAELQYKDSIAPHGEIRNARIVTHVMNQAGLKTITYFPSQGFITDGRFGNATLLPSSYAKIGADISRLLESGYYVVVPGYHGVDQARKGNFTTFDRGGTDFTGAAVANAINAALYEAFKDVTGVKRADPKVVPEAETIRHMNYDELEEMGYTGSKVILFDAIAPLIPKNIPLRVRSVRELDDLGTLVDGNGSREFRGITGISHKEQCYRLQLFKRGIRDAPGYGAKLYNMLSTLGISYDYTFDGANNIGFILSSITKDEVEQVKAMLEGNPDLSPDSVIVRQNKTVISVVGEGMENHSARVMHTLSGVFYRENINFERSSQGSPRSTLFVVDDSDGHRAVRALYTTLKETNGFKVE